MYYLPFRSAHSLPNILSYSARSNFAAERYAFYRGPVFFYAVHVCPSYYGFRRAVLFYKRISLLQHLERGRVRLYPAARGKRGASQECKVRICGLLLSLWHRAGDYCKMFDMAFSAGVCDNIIWCIISRGDPSEISVHTRAERKMLPYRQAAHGAAARSASLEIH